MDKKSNRVTTILPLVLFPAAAGLSFLYYHILINAYTDLTYGIIFGVLVLLALVMGALCAKARGGENAKTTKIVVSAVISAVVCAAMLFACIYGLGNVKTLNQPAQLCGIVAMNLYMVQMLVMLLLCKPVKKTAAVSIVLSVTLFITSGISMAAYPVFIEKYYKPVATPVGFGTYTEKEYAKVDNASFYVSANGNDNNNGSFGTPFATIEKARNAVRTLDKTGKTGITVAIMSGEYRTSGIEFTAEDSGTAECPITYCAYGDGEVILNGGVTLNPESFSIVSDEAQLSRLSEDAQKNVICTDLTKLGLSAADWGKIYTIGTYNTAAKYDGDYVGGIYSELFFNDTRMILARYPNGGFLETEKVLETGYGRETSATTARDDWDDVRNPQSDKYEISKELTDRIASWKTLDDVWMFGFWKYDWADAASPIGEFNAENRSISPKFVSLYGTAEGAPYYFFNIFEELDVPGEWYLDRENGIIYMYPTGDMSAAEIYLSLTSGNIITVNNADYITFEGITVKGTRGNAMELTGNNLTVKSCLIKNVGEDALLMTGYNNLAEENEITHTGKRGIILDGGDRETLTAGNNKADNNLIHDWSEIYQTYQSAITLNGVGNVCSHNEIYNSPHEAITWTGNNHMIEYNNIHNVCLLSDDAGAIYAGRRWDWYGTTIRYNAVYDLGSGEHRPNGIYLDDALSGISVYGNLLVNIPGNAFQLGGGRDLECCNNIVINSGRVAIHYSDVARDGAINNGWFNHSAKGGDMWQNLYNSPWKSEIWQNAFPAMARFSDDFNDADNLDFVPNPANSNVTGNLLINLKGEIGEIADSDYTFSKIENNAIYKLISRNNLFTDSDNGDYSLKADSRLLEVLPEFKAIPISEIGRY